MKGFDVAKNHIGLQEVRDRSELIKLFKLVAKNNDIVIDPSKTPWCAAWINYCERAAGKPGNGKLNARSFLTYGNKVEGDDAELGDILIFTRGSNTWQGHVCYFVDWDDDNNTVICLGGNQSDMVCYTHYSQDRLIGIRRS